MNRILLALAICLAAASANADVLRCHVKEERHLGEDGGLVVYPRLVQRDFTIDTATGFIREQGWR